MKPETDFLDKLKNWLNLFWTMFKIGICTFGGGYVMIGIIEKELGEKKKWIKSEELLDYIAISQITPGVIAVNVSTFVGRKKMGWPGAIAATLGVITPSIIIILIIASVLTNFADNEYVKHAFAGIRVVVCAIIINATIGLFKKSVVDPLTLVVFIGVFIVAAFTKLEVIFIVLIVIAISVVITLLNSKKTVTFFENTDKEAKK